MSELPCDQAGEATIRQLLLDKICESEAGIEEDELDGWLRSNGSLLHVGHVEDLVREGKVVVWFRGMVGSPGRDKFYASPVPEGMKRCTRCGGIKERTLACFPHRKDSADGLRGQCRKCCDFGNLSASQKKRREFFEAEAKRLQYESPTAHDVQLQSLTETREKEGKARYVGADPEKGMYSDRSVKVMPKPVNVVKLYDSAIRRIYGTNKRAKTNGHVCGCIADGGIFPTGS